MRRLNCSLQSLLVLAFYKSVIQFIKSILGDISHALGKSIFFPRIIRIQN